MIQGGDHLANEPECVSLDEVFANNWLFVSSRAVDPSFALRVVDKDKILGKGSRKTIDGHARVRTFGWHASSRRRGGGCRRV